MPGFEFGKEIPGWTASSFLCVFQALPDSLNSILSSSEIEKPLISGRALYNDFGLAFMRKN